MFERRLPWLSAVAVLSFGAEPPSLVAQEFHVDRRAENEVRFVSETTLDEFDGVTDAIDGYVLLDGPTLSAETGGDDTELHLEVELAGIDTGIGLRNRHMRDNYLEVEDHPYAVYSGRIVRAEPTGSGAFRVTSSGTFAVHGVERPREITCDVSPDGAGYRVRCAFPVLLTDHDIEIPSVMFMKLADEVRVELDFTVAPAANRSGDAP